ncbi:terminase large subunit [Halomonas litopenaei]|uniref:terminase large subunit n=1 Tax=Halomonas litopenaei TaxID=2109328 RepID=UPI001A8E9AFC|nr:terminase TerL endonuclease subunit [Halomonas litopenaei]MBN8410701.1 terminase large subunit [Halomonas litopenaei]
MTRGEKVISFIETFCKVPEGKLIGQPINLADFQKRFILDVYDNPVGTTDGYLSIARKNGKTGLIAGILLAHLVGPEAKQNSQIVSGAMSREQAGIVFKLAWKMVNLNPKLQDIIHVVPSSKTLIGLPCNVEYKALAAEGKTTHGLSPILAILDEVGQVRGPQDDFIDAITTAQGAHDAPLLLAISTQAATDADLLSVWLDDAERSGDPHIVSHVYAAPKDAELDDESAWKAANPALDLFRSRADMEKQANRAKRMPSAENTFRNLNLNQRVSTVSPFVSPDAWKACGGDPERLEGLVAYSGLDLSARTDLTACVIVGRDADGVAHVWPYFWTPEKGLHERAKTDRVPYDAWVRDGWLRTTPGATVDYSFVAAEMAEIMADLDVELVAFDRWRIDVFKKDAEHLGMEFPLAPFGQGFKDMSPALDILEADLLNGRIRHGNHPVLTMCAANAVVTKDAAGNRKLDKHKATGRIDGMVALAMALGCAGAGEVAEDYDDFIDNMIMVGV